LAARHQTSAWPPVHRRTAGLSMGPIYQCSL